MANERKRRNIWFDPSYTNNLWGNIPTPSQKSNLVSQVSTIIGQPLHVKEFAWEFVDDNGSFTSPATSKFSVTAGGSTPGVSETGFKRRPLYAPFETFDYRLEKTIFLKLSSQIPANTTVEVKNPDGSYWPATLRFVATNDPGRYSPAIHVNQQGYSPTYQKKAMIGYSLGSLGEMQISTNLGFSIVDALTGAQATTGSLSARADDPTTWAAGQAQYQKVVEADFTGLGTTGQYKLLVPGLGASYPFWIHDGSAMALARTYALGLYNQRCGAGPNGRQVNDLPFTRFVHANCHTNNASVPLPVSSYTDTWDIMANNYGTATYANSDNPPQIAPPVTNYSAFLFPYSNAPALGIDVSGGHHDAGDYSKYTINSALLIHILTFAADNLGLTNFLNFGIAKGSNTVPDVLEEARIEADFLVKLQDADGGFYFLVYPRNREYEVDVLPQNGDPQIVWPKTTAATAAAVAALAEVASSPAFSRVPSFQSLTNGYMQAALKGWTFLTNAIARRGKIECYQRITTYGDDFTHDDELAWAAAALYGATRSSFYWNKLYQWYPNPTDGHNGYNFKRYNSTNNFPASTNLFVAVAYVPKTNDVLNTTNHMWFTIWDSTGQKLLTNKIDTAIPHIADIIDISNRLFQLKTNFNTYPDSLDRNYALDAISSLVGECHKTWRDGWLRCFAGYGCAVRDYAFAARSGRLGTNLLNSSYLQQCEAEITNRAADVRTWSTNNAYGTSLDPASKSLYSKGWFFGGEQAFDVAVANQIQSHPGNIPTIIENLNYEAGRNPLNVSRLTGIGSYQQREVVHQFAQNNALAVLPPTGVPLGNIASYFDIPIQSTAWQYGYLDSVCFPVLADQLVDKTTFPLYDRWAETYNIHTEFVALQTARGLVSAAYLVNSAAIRTQAWSFATAGIDFPSGPPALATKCVARLVSTQDLSQARIMWDPGRASWNFLGQNPAVGTNFTFIPASVGDGRTLEAEALLPDGRRLFVVTNLFIFDPVRGGTNFLINDTNTIALYHFDATNSGKFPDATANHLDLTICGKAALATNTSWMRCPTGAVVRFRTVGTMSRSPTSPTQ